MLCAALCLCLLIHVTCTRADNSAEGGALTAHFGPYVYHYGNGSGRNSLPWFVALEWESASRWEVGGSFFRNSHYQPCGYIYGGKRWIVGPMDNHLFFKITAGAILGYVKPYDHKIPINHDGIGLGIIPAIGYKYRRVSTQFVILGTAGFMLTVGYDIWK